MAESVRDTGDIYLSAKYPPPVFITDLPRGFARHMDCRIPEVTKIMWADKCGCFEKPELGKRPNVRISVHLYASVNISPLILAGDFHNHIYRSVTHDVLA